MFKNLGQCLIWIIVIYKFYNENDMYRGPWVVIDLGTFTFSDHRESSRDIWEISQQW